jgi:GDP-L-fucose synthase
MEVATRIVVSEPASSHVLPALLRKMRGAKEAGAEEARVWGTGSVRRGFLHADDVADACVFLMNLPDTAFGPIAHGESDPSPVNVGRGEDLTLRELAELIREVMGFAGRWTFDASTPDGTPGKPLDVSRIKAFGWQAGIPLRGGLAAVCREYSAIQAATQEQPIDAARVVP